MLNTRNTQARNFWLILPAVVEGSFTEHDHQAVAIHVSRSAEAGIDHSLACCQMSGPGCSAVTSSGSGVVGFRHQEAEGRSGIPDA